MMKKALALLLAAIMLLTTASGAMAATVPADAKPTFTDVPATHWAYDPVESGYKKGLIAGIGNNLFDPESNLTRAQVAQICFNAYQTKLSGTKTATILDVKDDAWYSAAVKWMIANELVLGTPDGNGIRYAPEAKADRKYTALVLYRLATKLGVKLPETVQAVAFPDILELEAGYQTAINALQRAGVISGFPDGGYHPDENLTRAQAAKLFDVFTDIDGLQPPQKPVTPPTPPPTPTPDKPTGTPPDGDPLTDAPSSYYASKITEQYNELKTYAESLGYNVGTPLLNDILVRDSNAIYHYDLSIRNDTYYFATWFFVRFTDDTEYVKGQTGTAGYYYSYFRRTIYRISGWEEMPSGNPILNLKEMKECLVEYAD